MSSLNPPAVPKERIVIPSYPFTQMWVQVEEEGVKT